MRLTDKMLIMEGIHLAIKNKVVGSPKEIAKKLKISRACLYNYINDLKGRGAEIDYNRVNCHFYYKNDFDLKIIFRKTKRY